MYESKKNDHDAHLLEFNIKSYQIVKLYRHAPGTIVTQHWFRLSAIQTEGEGEYHDPESGR